MKYLLLIYNNDVTATNFTSPEGRPAFDAAHGDINAELIGAGELIGSHELDIDDAKVVRVPAGEPLVSDGPFTESKEWVGGYYLVDVRDEGRALEIAKRFEEARTALVEVRRLL